MQPRYSVFIRSPLHVHHTSSVDIAFSARWLDALNVAWKLGVDDLPHRIALLHAARPSSDAPLEGLKLCIAGGETSIVVSGSGRQGCLEAAARAPAKLKVHLTACVDVVHLELARDESGFTDLVARAMAFVLADRLGAVLLDANGSWWRHLHREQGSFLENFERVEPVWFDSGPFERPSLGFDRVDDSAVGARA